VIRPDEVDSAEPYLIYSKIGRTDAYNSSIELDGIQKVVFEIIIQYTI
jgi:hypothetical protein